VPFCPFGDWVEHETLDVFSPWGDVAEMSVTYIEIVFEMCPRCHAIEVSNQCIT
jgi:hypothetical protein